MIPVGDDILDNYNFGYKTEEVAINGEVINNRIYVPLTELTIFFGAETREHDNTITILYNDYRSIIEIDNPVIKVNYSDIAFNDPAVRIENEIYIPLQYLSEIFDTEPQYDHTSNEIIVSRVFRKFDPKMTVFIDGHKVNQYPFEITVDPSFSNGSLLSDHVGYPEETIKTLHEKYAIKDSYTYNDISYYQWLVDLHNICLFATQNDRVDEAIPQINHMIEYISSFLIERNGSFYVEYPYDYTVFDQNHRSGWVSAIGNSFVMRGFLEAYLITNIDEYKVIAGKLADSFLDLRDHKNQTMPWVSFVDDDGFLWFEEMPFSLEPQTRILNGHMACIEALYAYYLLNPRPEILEIIKAGITTVYCNIEKYRKPNNIHAYALYDLVIADYGQLRNLNQLENLYNLTHDDYFLFMRSNFDNDYRRSGKPLK